MLGTWLGISNNANLVCLTEAIMKTPITNTTVRGIDHENAAEFTHLEVEGFIEDNDIIYNQHDGRKY